MRYLFEDPGQPSVEEARLLQIFPTRSWRDRTRLVSDRIDKLEPRKLSSVGSDWKKMKDQRPRRDIIRLLAHLGTRKMLFQCRI